MTKRFRILTLMASLVVIGACLSALFARDDAPTTWKALEKGYAQANLELAQARLAQAKSENATVRGAVSQGMLGELQAGLQLAQDRVRQLESISNVDPDAPQVVAAQDAVNGLEAGYNESLKANQIQAGSVSDFELRREQAEINVAKARLNALKLLAQQPPEVRVQWQIGQLQDEIRSLWARPLIED